MATGYGSTKPRVKQKHRTRKQPQDTPKPQRRTLSLRGLPPLCGVYAIEHLQSGMKYIGGSCHIRRRWYHHRHGLRRGIHACLQLQAAWTADGPQAFTLVILELCEPHDLRQRETYHQRSCARLYNTNKTWAYAPLSGEALREAMELWRPLRA